MFIHFGFIQLTLGDHEWVEWLIFKNTENRTQYIEQRKKKAEHRTQNLNIYAILNTHVHPFLVYSPNFGLTWLSWMAYIWEHRKQKTEHWTQIKENRMKNAGCRTCHFKHTCSFIFGLFNQLWVNMPELNGLYLIRWLY